jgi:hypothetical protein
MSRSIKLITREKGELHLLLLTGWEGEWAILRGTVYGDLLSVISRDVVDHALHGWSRPLVDALGIPPDGALRKVPVAARWCWLKHKRPPHLRSCPLQGPECHHVAKKMPWCFEPTEADDSIRRMAAKAIEQWREGVYVVVVEEAYD